jgi:lipopolysaccharide export system ATP-binding protein
MNEPAPPPTEGLDAVGLVKAYGGRRVVDGVDLGVRPGEVVGLLGPNGAGKTTTFHMIMGLVRPDFGQVRLGALDLTRWPMHRRARAGVGYLSQEASVFRRLSVRDNLRVYLEACGQRGRAAEERVEQSLAEFDLGRLAEALGATLSGGERRRLEIARAMIQQPRFLLLDEPFSGVDPLAVDEIRSRILRLARAGVGLLLTDHNVRETLSTCDRAYIVKDGKIIEEGAPAAIAQSPRARASYLGARFRLDDGA